MLSGERIQQAISYLRLWGSCLLQALDDCWDRRETIRDPAQAWLHDTRRGPCTFTWVCELFDLDPGRTRALIVGNRNAYAELKRRVMAQERRRKRQLSGEE